MMCDASFVLKRSFLPLRESEVLLGTVLDTTHMSRTVNPFLGHPGMSLVRVNSLVEGVSHTIKERDVRSISRHCSTINKLLIQLFCMNTGIMAMLVAFQGWIGQSKLGIYSRAKAMRVLGLRLGGF